MLKKSTIIALAGSLIIGGIGLSIAGVALGGKTQVSYGGIHQFFEQADASFETIGYVDGNKGQNIIKKENSVISEKLEHFTNIDIAVGTIALNVVEGEAYKIDIDIKSHVALSYGVKGNTLYVKQKNEEYSHGINLNDVSDGSITITVPGAIKFEEIEIDLGVGMGLIEGIKTKELNIESGVGFVKIKQVIADEVNISGGVGNLEINGLTSEKTKVEGGVGSIQVYDLKSSKLEASIGVGSVLIEGDIDGNINIEGGLGGLELALVGRESDYNYSIERGAGKIIINETKQSGVGDVKVRNNAKYDVDISAGLGDIKIITKE